MGINKSFYYKVTSKLGPFNDSEIIINDFKINMGVRGVFIMDFNPSALNEVTFMNFDTYADNLFAIDFKPYCENLATKNLNNFVLIMSHDECFNKMNENQKNYLLRLVGEQYYCSFNQGSSFAVLLSKENGRLKVLNSVFNRGEAILEGSI